MSGVVFNSYQDSIGAIERALDPSHGQATISYVNNVASVEVNGQTATVSYADGVSTITSDGKSTTVTAQTFASSSSNSGSNLAPKLSAREPDTISLSASAQSWLNNDQIALDLISGSKSAISQNASSSQDAGKGVSSDQKNSDQTSTSQSTADQTSQQPATALSIANLVAQQQLQLADPNYIYQRFASQGGIAGLVQEFQWSGESQDYINSFISAYNNQSFNVQVTSTLPGVSVNNTEVDGPQGGSQLGGSVNGIGAVEQAAQQNGLYYLDAGGVFLTWSPGNSTTPSNGDTTPSNGSTTSA
jgi:hypothetical protein